MVAAVVVSFVVLVALSTPIVFALGLSGMLGLVLGNFSLQKLPSALVAGSQSWVLLAVPTFILPAVSWSAAGCPTPSSTSRAAWGAGGVGGSACRWSPPSTSSPAFPAPPS